jgi:hypothetical protein
VGYTPAWVLRDWLPLANRPELGEQLTTWGGRALLAAVYVVALVWALRFPRLSLRWLLGFSVAAFLASLFGALYFQPWYFAWPLALLALMPSWRTVALSLALSLPVMFLEPFARWAGVIFFYNPVDEFFFYHRFFAKVLTASLAFALPAAVCVVLLIPWIRSILRGGQGTDRQPAAEA